MTEYPRFGVDPDKEADKLGSYHLADNRYGQTDDQDPDHPHGTGKPAKRNRRPTGRPLEGPSGVEQSTREASASWQRQDALGRIRTSSWANAARDALNEVKPHEPTAEEIADRNAKNGAEVVRRARESWER